MTSSSPVARLYKNKKVPVAALTPYALNARTHSEAQVADIAASIMEFGFTNPVLIDERSVIIAGHGRVMAATRLGMDKVPCVIIAGLTELQRKAYVLADNRLALNAGWDEELLQRELADLQSEEFNLELLGFSDPELRSYLEPTAEERQLEGALPKPGADPVSKPGDLWILGNHRLLCGDPAMLGDLEKLLEGRAIDQVVTSIPEPGWDEDDPTAEGGFLETVRDTLANVLIVMKSGACFYLFYRDKDTLIAREAFEEAGLAYRQVLIWRSSPLAPKTPTDYHLEHEPCLYGWKSGVAHLWAADRRQTTVLLFDRPDPDSPRRKPVALAEYCILNNTKSGDAVLDPYAGNGTVIVAAERVGRHAFAIERSPSQCDVAIRRWEEHTGRAAVLNLTESTFSDIAKAVA